MDVRAEFLGCGCTGRVPDVVIARKWLCGQGGLATHLMDGMGQNHSHRIVAASGPVITRRKSKNPKTSS